MLFFKIICLPPFKKNKNKILCVPKLHNMINKDDLENESTESSLLCMDRLKVFNINVKQIIRSLWVEGNIA